MAGEEGECPVCQSRRVSSDLSPARGESRERGPGPGGVCPALSTLGSSGARRQREDIIGCLFITKIKAVVSFCSVIDSSAITIYPRLDE